MALLTKLPNFTSPGPEFLLRKFGASGVPLKGVRLMRSLKRHRQYHSFHLKSVLCSLITSQQKKRTRRMNLQTSPPTHFSCFYCICNCKYFISCVKGHIKDVSVHAHSKHKNNTKRKPTENKQNEKGQLTTKKHTKIKQNTRFICI